MRKNLLIGSAIAVVALATLGTGAIYAQTTTSRKSIVDRIAERFGLEKADVQQVFDQQRSDMQQERQQNLENKLNQLVTDGKLTEDQKMKLLGKLNERKNNMQDFRDLTKDQIKEKMEQERSDFDSWLKDNKINLDELNLGFGIGRGGFEKGPHGGDWDKSDTK